MNQNVVFLILIINERWKMFVWQVNSEQNSKNQKIKKVSEKQLTRQLL